MSEDEAKAKWCPFIRLTAEGEEWHTNRPGVDSPGEADSYRCIASACMAWRTTPLWTADKTSWVPTGHCGLAGAPS